MKKLSGKSALVILAAVLGVACVQFGFAQTFKNVPDASDFSQVSAGGQSVWALANSGGLSFYETGSGDGGWVFNGSARSQKNLSDVSSFARQFRFHH
ncbi:MAG: hypothetical protein ABSD75_15460 [Terriglobales bacterium]|jgi:hypothetical protein